MTSWCHISVLLVVTSACIFGAGNKVVKKRSRDKAIRWFEEKDVHKGRDISNDDFRLLTIGEESHFWKILDNILIPRVVGSPGHKKVRDYIVNELSNLKWTVEQGSFEADTPIGAKNFTNIIATLDPSAQRRLVLACHYDSKLTPKGFLGATDSAVPCSMLINLAYVLQKELTKHKNQNSKVTLQLIFIDGEEAFKSWTATDSLYGARNLAAKLEQTSYPLGSADNTNELHRMDLFVLLDLIGTPDCSIHSFFRETDGWYNNLQLFEQKLLKMKKNKNRKFLFSNRVSHSHIEDDHIPFLQRGVPILHLICVPFPRVWHKMSDNRSALDEPTIEQWNILMRAFVAHYLHLTPIA